MDTSEVVTLVERARAGDRTAEEALCARFVPVAQVFFLRRAGSRDADDLAQEAVLTMLRALREGSLREDERLGGFLLGVCRNLIRRRARSDERTDRALSRLSTDEVFEREPLVDAHKLWTCVNALGGRAREVIVRTFVDDEDAPTIAAALSFTEANVRVVRHRALAALFRCVEGGDR